MPSSSVPSPDRIFTDALLAAYAAHPPSLLVVINLIALGMAAGWLATVAGAFVQGSTPRLRDCLTAFLGVPLALVLAHWTLLVLTGLDQVYVLALAVWVGLAVLATYGLVGVLAWVLETCLWVTPPSIFDALAACAVRLHRWRDRRRPHALIVGKPGRHFQSAVPLSPSPGGSPVRSLLSRVLNSIRPYLPMLIVGLYLALLPSGAATAAPIDDIFVRTCTAGSVATTFIAQSFTGFLPALLGVGAFVAATERGRQMAGSAVHGVVHHVTDMGFSGVFLVGAVLVGSVITTAVAGRACP